MENPADLSIHAPKVPKPGEPIETDHYRIPYFHPPYYLQFWTWSAHYTLPNVRLKRIMDVQNITDWRVDETMESPGDDRKRYNQAPLDAMMKGIFGGTLGLWICSITSLVLGAAAQHPVPGVITHIAAGTSIAASIMFPPLRNGGELAQPSCLVPAVYGTWGVAFVTLLVCELLRRPTGLQRRLLVGTVLFSSLNLLGTLSQSAPSTLEGIMSWGPMALTASLCVIPVVMDMVSPRSAAEMVANMAGVHIPVQEPRRVYQGQQWG